MRILLAKLLAVVTALLIVVLAVLFATLGGGPDQLEIVPEKVVPSIPQQTGQSDERIARGHKVYLGQRCQKCHSMHGEGNTRSPLDGVGRRLSEKDIRLWITAPKTMKPGITKRAYSLSEEDLDALVEYLTTGDPGAR